MWLRTAVVAEGDAEIKDVRVRRLRPHCVLAGWHRHGKRMATSCPSEQSWWPSEAAVCWVPSRPRPRATPPDPCQPQFQAAAAGSRTFFYSPILPLPREGDTDAERIIRVGKDFFCSHVLVPSTLLITVSGSLSLGHSGIVEAIAVRWSTIKC